MARNSNVDMSRQYAQDMQRLIDASQMQESALMSSKAYTKTSFVDLYAPITASVQAAFNSRINGFWQERIQLEKTMQYEAMLEAARQKRLKSLSIEDSYSLPDIAPDKLSLLDKLFGKRSTK